MRMSPIANPTGLGADCLALVTMLSKNWLEELMFVEGKV